jgi:hypothetical protein
MAPGYTNKLKNLFSAKGLFPLFSKLHCRFAVIRCQTKCNKIWNCCDIFPISFAGEKFTIAIIFYNNVQHPRCLHETFRIDFPMFGVFLWFFQQTGTWVNTFGIRFLKDKFYVFSVNQVKTNVICFW